MENSSLRIFPDIHKFVILNIQDFYITGIIIFALLNRKGKYIAPLLVVIFWFNVIKKLSRPTIKNQKKHKKAVKIMALIV